jgi:CubicO group peptidase (beta-lactamase class C family)
MGFASSGLTSDGSPVTEHTVMHAASVSKQVTGVCAALLVAEAHLNVQEPLAEWRPELPGWAQRVRVGHLVHHTAGLPDHPQIIARGLSMGGTDWTTETILAAGDLSRS